MQGFDWENYIKLSREGMPKQETPETLIHELPPEDTAKIKNYLLQNVGNPMTSAQMFQQILANQAKITALKTQPTKDANGRFKSGLRALAEGLGKAFDPRAGMIRNWGDFGVRLAGAGTQGAMGAILPDWDENADANRQIGDLNAENEQLSANAENAFRREMVVNKAQQDQEEFDARMRLNREKWTADQKLKEDKYRNELRKSFFTRNSSFNPQTATDAQRRELAEFGETPESIGIYDNTNPNFKQIGGVTFEWNNATKTFDATNLPTDASKEIVEYTVTDNNGIKRTFAVPVDKAASLTNSLRVAGMNIEAATARQALQQNFQAGQNELSRQNQQALQESAQKFQLKMHSIRSENEATQEIQKAMKEGQERMSKGLLTKEAYDNGIRQMINMLSPDLREKMLTRFGVQ
jgi:hypothetical protein